MARCNETPAPTCNLTCEEIECEINASKVNIDNLFDRTDDLNEKVDGFDERIAEVEGLTEAQNIAIAAIAGNLTVETNARIAGDAAANAARAAGDLALAGSINTTNINVTNEINARIAGDLANAGQISSLDSRVALLEGQFTIVDTQAEFEAALLNGGLILVRGLIVSTANLNVTVDDTTIISIPDSGNVRGGVYRDQTDVIVAFNNIHVRAKRCKIIGLEITTDHPLTADLAGLNDNSVAGPAGIRIDPTVDTSGLEIRDCLIHRFANGIIRQGSSSSVSMERFRIENNFIHSVYSGGINLNGRSAYGVIRRNVLFGRLTSAAIHPVHFNGMYIANRNDYITVDNNIVARFGRHAIEYWNSAANQNLNGKITNNIIFDNGYDTAIGAAITKTTTVGSFGISAFGNGTLLVAGNFVTGGQGIGIEVFNDVNSTAINHITDNHLLFIRSDQIPVGMSLDGVRNAIVENNVFHGTVSTDATAAQYGLQIFNSAHNVTVRNNEFINAGNVMLYVNNPGAAGGYRNLIIDGNTFRTTSAVPQPAGEPINAIRVGLITEAVVRNNVSFRPTAATTHGLFVMTAAGTVYEGNAADAAHVWAAGVEDIEGTNLVIDN